MCIEDVRLGRKSPGQPVRVTVGTSSTLLIGPDQDRFCLVVSGPASNPMWLSRNNDAANAVGLRIPAGTLPFTLTVKEHGQLCTSAWYAAIPAGAEAITVESVSLGVQ